MSAVDWMLDGLLAAVLLVLAVRVLSVPDLFHAVVLFICLGLLMALAWVRLAAPDVALAEAGIGAALTGVLLVDLLHKLSWRGSSGAPPRQQDLRASGSARFLGALAALGLLLLLVKTVLALPMRGPGLAPAVAARLEQAGAEHGVTAVLLDFRSLDTLLELGVLFVAVLGVLSLRRAQHAPRPITTAIERDAITEWLPRLLLPLLIAVAGYLLWLGSFTAGGAFQSGIVLASAVVLLWLKGQPTLELLPGWLWRALLICGLAAFLVLGSALLLLGRAFLDYPREWADTLVLLLELAAAVGVGAALATLAIGLTAPEHETIRGSPAP